MKIIKTISFCALFCFATSLAKAQNAVNTPDTITVGDFYLDFSVPDIGAFTLLNTKPTSISNPGNTKEFAASLLNVVGDRSRISPGLAIDWAPYRIFHDSTVLRSPQDYRKSSAWRNLQVTFGTIADSAGTRVGSGIKWTILDKSDPLMDADYGKALLEKHHSIFVSKEIVKNNFEISIDVFLHKIIFDRNFTDSVTKYFELRELIAPMLDENDIEIQKKEISIINQAVVDTINNFFSRNSAAKLSVVETVLSNNLCCRLKTIGIAEEEYDATLTKDFKKMKKDWMDQHWNASVITLGVGWVGNSTDSKWATLKTQEMKGFVNGKFGIGHRKQITYLATFGLPNNDSTINSTVICQFFGGGRFLVGNARNRFSIDLGYGYDIAKQSSFNKQKFLADLGFEFKIDDGIFFEIAAGVSGDPSQLKNANILALGSLKYAFHKKSRFDLPD